MSRVVVLGLDNASQDQFDAICTLGYSLGGNPSTQPGSSTTVRIPASMYRKTTLNFGRAVVIQPEDLPPYFGIIDTPWNAIKPVTMTIYDVEYLMSLRSPEAPIKLTGSVDRIMSQMIALLNYQEDLNIRMGNVGEVDKTSREETLDGRTYWEQFQALALRSGTEFVFRPERGADKRWYLYLDLAKSAGVDTDFLLSDGDRGNMKVTAATVKGEIVNRVIGISSQSTQQSRLMTAPLVNEESIRQHRMRNKTVQFRDVTDIKTLTRNTQNSLDASSFGYLEMAVQVQNIDHAFLHLRQGNRAMVHASTIVLPGGIQGWRGKAKMTKLVFLEATKSVAMNITGAL